MFKILYSHISDRNVVSFSIMLNEAESDRPPPLRGPALPCSLCCVWWHWWDRHIPGDARHPASPGGTGTPASPTPGWPAGRPRPSPSTSYSPGTPPVFSNISREEAEEPFYQPAFWGRCYWDYIEQYKVLATFCARPAVAVWEDLSQLTSHGNTRPPRHLSQSPPTEDRQKY